MKEFISTIGLIIIGVIILLAFSWAIQGNDFFLYKVFAPQYEQTRREVFEQSKAYNQGMVMEIQSMQFQWYQADSGHKDALADLILHRVADFDMNRMPLELRSFIQQLREEKKTPKEMK
jgi:hypothetical protein